MMDYSKEYPGYDVREAAGYGEAIEAVLRGGGKVEAQAESFGPGHRLRLHNHSVLSDGTGKDPIILTGDMERTWLILTKKQPQCPTCPGETDSEGTSCCDCIVAMDAPAGSFKWAVLSSLDGWEVHHQRYSAGWSGLGAADVDYCSRNFPTGWSRRKLEGGSK